jgi:uncharacterized membrane protein
MHDQVEHWISSGVEWLRLAVESVGALIIAIGVLAALAILLRALLRREGGSLAAARLALARYLALALEFQLAADILSTAIAPTWERIGQLGAIAVIRTLLNYFLRLEMREDHPQPPPH